MKLISRLLVLGFLSVLAGAGVLEARAFDSTPDLQLGADPDERWAPGFAPAGCNGVIFDLEEGPSGELYVGGKFTECGGVEVNNIARYEPAAGTWSALGSEGGNGVDDRVRALAWVGGDLYVGGELLSANVGGDAGSVVPANRIARWDGSSWHALGSGGGNGVDDTVLVLAEMGGDLYAGGNFDVANVDVANVDVANVDVANGNVANGNVAGLDVANGGSSVTVNRIARWDGTSWSALGSGGGAGASSNVFALAEFDGDLYVGGVFQEVNVGAPVSARFLARWDGTSWTALGSSDGLTGAVSAFAVSGGDLYVGGNFAAFVQDSAFEVANSIARWDGASWSIVGSDGGRGVSGPVSSMGVLGGDLYVVGSFSQVNLAAAIPAHSIARWDGAVWSAVGSGGGEGFSGASNSVAVTGGRLYVGGALERANLGGEEIAARRLAAWDGASWSSVAPSGGVGVSTPQGLPSRVEAVAVRGDIVYFGGFFREAGGLAANNIVAYDRASSTWSTLGSGAGNGVNNTVRALVVDGDDLYVGGDFTEVNTGDPVAAHRVARWDGTSWHAVEGVGGQGVNNQVHALAKCGDDLYVGGKFGVVNLGAGVTANRIARWDGTSWHALGSGGGNGVSSDVYALACAGTGVYAGGFFVNANLGDEVPVNRVARWDGASWHALGSGGGAGVNGVVNALAVSGDEVYVGGTFTLANVGAALSANHVARWDGSGWSSVGGGVNSTVWTLLLDGEELYAGGAFTEANLASPVGAARLAHWTGSDWAPLASGTNGSVRALALAAPDTLAVGGDFDLAGGKLSSRVGFYLARGTLTLSIDSGFGEITSSPAGLACPGTCSADFAWDTPITLTATPEPGWAFESFTGACSEQPCVVRLADDDAVGVSFALVQEADLEIAVVDAQDPLPSGVNVSYTVEVTNLAPLFQATGVTVSAALPAGLTLVSTSGCLEDPAGLPTCTLGVLDAGASASFTVEATVEAGAGDSVLFEACVAGADADPQPANDCAGEATSLDLAAPTVTEVVAGSAAAGAAAASALGSCDTVLHGVSALEVAFSEPLLATGGGDPASVEDPANYRLVRPAAGSGFATLDCQSGPGSDTVIPLAAVAWDAGARLASLAPGVPRLEDGLYRLLVCGTLEDEAGNALDGGAGAGSDFAVTFRVDAQNLLADGHFDRHDPACTLGAWTSSDLAQVEIDDPDAEGSPLSGSAHNVSAAAGLDLGQCVDLEENGLYVLEGDARVDSASVDTEIAVTVELFCDHYGATACAGPVLTTSQQAAAVADTEEAFESLTLELAAPAGAASALCGVAVDPGDALAFDVYLDRVMLKILPLFADGFESGDLSAWSTSQP